VVKKYEPLRILIDVSLFQKHWKLSIIITVLGPSWQTRFLSTWQPVSSTILWESSAFYCYGNTVLGGTEKIGHVYCMINVVRTTLHTGNTCFSTTC